MIQLAAHSGMNNGGFYRLDSVWLCLKQHIEACFILAVITVSGIVSAQHDFLTERIVAHPRKSDFFYVDYRAINPDSDFYFRYIPMKVLRVKQDSVIFKVGNIAHSTPVTPRKHAMYDSAMQRNYYRDKTLELSRAQIDDLFKSGAIYQARRPDNIYIDGWVVIPRHEAYIE
ncbi:hypothetical protein [Neptunicella marina]|uniref:Uncharacterized protein n=1 Tax=Neptunicella marina TaxID=2125989 RepID=A0A8J6IT72_9ALTE|nr:hypothetical protein [Neptunicella marina]MBC3765854.1 hypothetical protein [Neptunicella marina]